MTEQIEDWAKTQGQMLDGRFPILEALPGKADQAAFRTQAEGVDSIVRLAAAENPADPREVDRQLRRWRLPVARSHPNVLEVRAAGSCAVGEATYLYTVTEPWEDDLSTVLRERRLSVEEANSVMESMEPALDHLHSLGLSPGRIEPANIVAVGDTVKLKFEFLWPASEGKEDELSALRRMLLPQSAPPVKRVPPVEPLRQDEANAPTVPHISKRPLWLAAAAIVSVSVFGFWMAHSRSAAPLAPEARPAVSNPAHAPVPAPVPAALSGANWRVIAYTFRSQKAAETRAQRINAKWPEMKATVFTPVAGTAPYLVQLGQPGTRDDANRFRRKAVGSGLPRDTFARNFNQ